MSFDSVHLCLGICIYTRIILAFSAFFQTAEGVSDARYKGAVMSNMGWRK